MIVSIRLRRSLRWMSLDSTTVLWSRVSSTALLIGASFSATICSATSEMASEPELA